VKHTIEIPIPDKMEFEKYLRANEAKEAAPRYSRMEYDFPEIKAACPICGNADCAQWRGYYRRLIFCTEMEELKRIYVRVGRCRKTKESFRAVPSFLSQAGE
jgi:NADPH-dependent 7-cyano-7-deazaguanine reductase QueF